MDIENNNTNEETNSTNTLKIKFPTRLIENTVSDGEMGQTRSAIHRNSLTNLHFEEPIIQNISSIDILHKNETSNGLHIPIVGYEVMEERARFTIYKLKVEINNKSWLVFRRYTDFVRLYTRLKSQQPNIMLPLPGKRWFRDNFEPAFLEERVNGLQVFVNSLLKWVPEHKLVREFFCLDEPPEVSYQPEVQAIYSALEDTVSKLKCQLKQKDATINHLQNRLKQLEGSSKMCENCSANLS